MDGLLQPGPDEIALRRDLDGPTFRLGVRRGKWRLLRLAFPYAYFRLTAPTRAQGPEAFMLRVECAGYRATAPTAQLWDGLKDTALPDAQRPFGRNQGVMLFFTSSCGTCLYHPIDRMARSHWPGAHEEVAWGPDSDISTFLEVVHAAIHDSDYISSLAPTSAAELPPDLVV
jgi:hypothetical protein